VQDFECAGPRARSVGIVRICEAPDGKRTELQVPRRSAWSLKHDALSTSFLT
jgi:hypothetical protein